MIKEKSSIKHSFFITVGLFVGVFVTGADSFIISPLLPEISKNFNARISQVAYGVTFYALCYALGAPIFGPLGDYFDKKMLIMIGISIFLLGTILCAVASGLYTFYFYRAIAGIGASLFVPNVWAFIGEYFKDKQLNEVMGIVMSALSLSIAVGVPLGTTLSQLSNWHMAFWASGIMTLIAMIIIKYSIPKLKLEHNATTNYFGNFTRVLHTKNALPALTVTLLWMYGFYSIYTFLGTFITAKFDYNTGQTGYIFIAYGLSNFIASFFGGKLMSVLGKKTSILINGLISFFTIILIGLAGEHLLILILLLVLLACAQGFGVTALTSYIVNVVPSNRSTVMSFNSSFLYLGLTFGSIVGGWLFTQYGFEILTLSASLGILLALIVVITLKKKKNH